MKLKPSKTFSKLELFQKNFLCATKNMISYCSKIYQISYQVFAPAVAPVNTCCKGQMAADVGLK